MNADLLMAAREDLGGAELEILDCHGHVGPASNFLIPQPDAPALVRSMDLCGIRTSFVSSLLGMADEEVGHAEIRSAADQFPGRLAPVPIANPNHGRLTLDYLERCRTDDRIRLLKVHPAFHDYPVTGENYTPIFEFAGSVGWPVLSHTWGGDVDPAVFDGLARAHPGVVFILGHSGGTMAGIREAVSVARLHQNVFLDLASSMPYDGVLEWIVDQVGDERVLFGTDASFLDPRPQVGRVLFARIPAISRIRILGASLAGLLDRQGVRGADPTRIVEGRQG